MNAERERWLARLAERVEARYAPNEYPALLDELERARDERPFEGVSLLDCTPLFTNTLAKFLPLLAGGAELAASVSPRIPHDPAVAKWLEDLGFPVVSERHPPTGSYDVILDCDGSRADLRSGCGVCELTRSGLYRYREATTPVVLVDSSRIKEIETTLGTGNGYLRGMRQLGQADFANRRVVLFGYGKVGRGVALACAAAGAAVTAVDRTDAGLDFDRTAVRDVIDLNDVESVRTAVRTADHVVTATGIRGAMRRFGLSAADLARPLVSAIGIEDEWAGAVRPPRLLAEGRAVNFCLQEPTLLRYIDPTMALSNESAHDLIAGRITATGIVSPRPETEAACLKSVFDAGLITGEIAHLGL